MSDEMKSCPVCGKAFSLKVVKLEKRAMVNWEDRVPITEDLTGLEIAVIIVCVVVFGVLGAGIGMPVAFIPENMGHWPGSLVWDCVAVMPAEEFRWFVGSMSVFGCIGAGIGGRVGYKFTRKFM